MAGSGNEESDTQLPGTIDEAVALVLSRMPEATGAFLLRFDDEIEVRVQLAKRFTAGMSVRAMLGLWGTNPALLAQLPPSARHPDDASSFFLVECWRRLREGRPEPGATTHAPSD
jgi:hypothetical protein